MIIGANLGTTQHPFVDNRARGEAGKVETFTTGQRSSTHAGANRVLRLFANHIKFAFKGQLITTGQAVGVAADKNLAHERLTRFGAVAQARIIDRHRTPA